MDMPFMSSASKEGFSRLKGELDKKLESILSRLDKGNCGSIGNEIQANFIKSALLIARRKIFDVALVVEEERQSLATVAIDADTFGVDDRADLHDKDYKSWLMINRRSKPKITDDIIRLVLFISLPKGIFPVSVLKKATDKSKVDANEPDLQVPASECADDWANDLSSEEDNVGASSNITTTNENLPSERIERYMIRESSSTELDITTVKAAEGVSRPATRTIATQTNPVAVHPLNTKCTSVDEAQPIATVSVSREAPSRDRTSTQSSSSVIEFIEEKYESVKNSANEMKSSKRKALTPSECERRLTDLEEKYETVIRKLDRVEKTHNNDIRCVRAEIDSKCKNTNVITQANLSNAIQGAYASNKGIGNPSNDAPAVALDDPLGSPGVDDMSMWGFDACNDNVITQDSQGNGVVTKATPFHEREIARKKASCECNCGHAEMSSKDGVETVTSGGQSNGPRNTRSAANRREEDSPIISSTPAMNAIVHEPRPSTSAGTSGRPQPSARPKVAAHETQRVQSSDDQPMDGGRPTKPSGIRPSRGRANTARDNGDNSSEGPKRRKVDNTDGGDPRSSGNTSETQKNKEPNGKSPPRSNANSSGSEGEGKISFAKVVTKNGWTGIMSSNGNESGNKRDFPPIKRAVPRKNKEMYVRGMSCGDFRVYRDLEEAVKLYCRERSVNTVFQRVISYNKENDNVGIKVVIRECDEERICSRGFWPDGISIREWSYDKPTGRERYFDVSSSDESL